MIAGRRTPWVLVLAALCLASPALADQPPAVDVAIKEPPPVHRAWLLEWNPFPLVAIGRLSANVVLAPGEHHAVILSPYYAWTNTSPIYVYDDAGHGTQLPAQHFEGGGAEAGYRYYFGRGGPRGLFLGPSLLFGGFQARAQDGSKTSYGNFGVAADVGYQALVADRLSLGLGAGLQYTFASESLPAQQFPAELYANAGLRPRVLLSIGWAL